MTTSTADDYLKTIKEITSEFQVMNAFLRILRDDELRENPSTPYEQTTVNTLEYILKGEVPETKTSRGNVRHRLIWLISVNGSTDNSDLQDHLESLLKAVNAVDRPPVAEEPEPSPVVTEPSQNSSMNDRWENEGGATEGEHAVSTYVDSLPSGDSEETSVSVSRHTLEAEVTSTIFQTLNARKQEVVDIVKSRIQYLLELETDTLSEPLYPQETSAVKEAFVQGRDVVTDKINVSYTWTKEGLAKLTKATRSGTQAFLQELKKS